MIKKIFWMPVLISMMACTVGPKYHRPDAAVPPAYRGSSASAQPDAASIADEKWWTVFQDPQLEQLIRAALAENYDLQIAAARVLQARAVVGVHRADQFPTVIAGAGAVNQRFPETVQSPAVETSAIAANLSMLWDLDFWGKFRKSTEAARADLLATEWGRRAVMTSIVVQVAAAYFQLRELDLEMEISQRVLQSRQESLRLVKVRAAGGVTSMLDVHQSEQLVYEIAGAIPDLERRIEQQENLISILLGHYAGPVARGKALTKFAISPAVPSGLPSTLLERRADIQAAEQTLIAQNARIGVARAAYFPQITLTATAGAQSSALTSLFSGPAAAWNLGGQLAQPIFTAGRIRSNVQFAEAAQQEALLVYRQSIQLAFREVSDALIAYQKNQIFREQQELLTKSAEGATVLSTARYQGGVTSYLEVLDSDSRYLAAQLRLAQAELNERLALVQLYGALGGGWQQ